MFDGHQVVCISYGDSGEYFSAAKLNATTALKRGKADKAIVYSRKDIDEEFIKDNQSIFAEKRGGGILVMETVYCYGDFEKS